MGLLEWLGQWRKPKASAQEPEQDPLAPYAGMRVEVTEENGRFLFVAKLMYPRRGAGELHQYSETAVTATAEEPIPVHIRGYDDHQRKAVYLEGRAHPEEHHIWPVTDLTIDRIENARAFYRLDTDLEASMTILKGPAAGERPCRLLNISIGGARVRSEAVLQPGGRFLLKVKLLEDRPESVIYSEVLRVLEEEKGACEYGCQFLELTEETQAKISQNIFDLQRKKRG